MLNDVKILINISAAPDTSIQLFHIVSQARALENSSYFIWVNSVGFDGGFGLGGASVIVDPLGNILYTLKYYEEETYVMDININEIITFRFKRPLLKDIIFEDFYILFRSILKTLKNK